MLIKRYMYFLLITLLLLLFVIVFQKIEMFELFGFLRGKDYPRDECKKGGTMKKTLLALNVFLFIIGALRRMIQLSQSPCLWLYILALDPIGNRKRIDSESVAYKIIRMPNKEVFDA